jgi:hypothetical protein
VSEANVKEVPNTEKGNKYVTRDERVKKNKNYEKLIFPVFLVYRGQAIG